ncbi:UDP-N-acetylmuramate dehydrogenase [Bacillota bacterium]
MKTDLIIEELAAQMEGLQIIKDAPMKEYTSFKAGGRAALLIVPDSIDKLQYAVKRVSAAGLPYYIMGNGTNILVKDGGYSGVIIKIGKALGGIRADGDRILADAGALLKDVSGAAAEKGLTGLEFASGIPGSIGGAAYMNAGAYDGDMSKVVGKVAAMKTDGSENVQFSADEMNYGYRSSRLMEEAAIVLSVELQLKEGIEKEIKEKVADYDERRRLKQPLDFPSAGSFFKRPPGNFAGTLIEKAGLKGMKVGGAMVSPLHAGFIVNTGGATAAHILGLMKLVQGRVYESSGIMLEPEVRIIGNDEGRGK